MIWLHAWHRNQCLMPQSTSSIFSRSHIRNQKWLWPLQNSDKIIIFCSVNNNRNIQIFRVLAPLKTAVTTLYRVPSEQIHDFKSPSKGKSSSHLGHTPRTPACKRCIRSCCNSRLKRREISWTCFKRRNRWCWRLSRIGRIIRTSIYSVSNSRSSRRMTCSRKSCNPLRFLSLSRDHSPKYPLNNRYLWLSRQ